MCHVLPLFKEPWSHLSTWVDHSSYKNTQVNTSHRPFTCASKGKIWEKRKEDELLIRILLWKHRDRVWVSKWVSAGVELHFLFCFQCLTMGSHVLFLCRITVIKYAQISEKLFSCGVWDVNVSFFKQEYEIRISATNNHTNWLNKELEKC